MVVASDFQDAGEVEVFRKVSDDVMAKGAPVSDEMIRQKMAELVQTARDQVLNEG